MCARNSLQLVSISRTKKHSGPHILKRSNLEQTLHTLVEFYNKLIKYTGNNTCLATFSSSAVSNSVRLFAIRIQTKISTRDHSTMYVTLTASIEVVKGSLCCHVLCMRERCTRDDKWIKSTLGASYHTLVRRRVLFQACELTEPLIAPRQDLNAVRRHAILRHQF
jgi:hypothetical protein